MDGWRDDGWMDGWVDGWMDKFHALIGRQVDRKIGT